MVRDCIVNVSAAIVKKFCFVLSSVVKNHVHCYCCHFCKQEPCIHFLSPDILIILLASLTTLGATNKIQKAQRFCQDLLQRGTKMKSLVLYSIFNSNFNHPHKNNWTKRKKKAWLLNIAFVIHEWMTKNFVDATYIFDRFVEVTLFMGRTKRKDKSKSGTKLL